MTNPLRSSNHGFINTNHIQCAYILAGGASRRMGQDKLFMSVEGATLLDRSIRNCRRVFGRVRIVAGDRTKFHKQKIEFIQDRPDAEGPMSGVIAALEDCPQESCFITAADLIDLDENILRMLLGEYRGEQYLGIAEMDEIQPLCGIYNKSSLQVLLSRARKGNFSMKEAVGRLKYRLLPPGSTKWRNLNLPQDLRE